MPASTAGYSPRRGPAPGTKIIVPDDGGRQVPLLPLTSVGGLPATGWVAAPLGCVSVLATVAFTELTVAVDALADAGWRDLAGLPARGRYAGLTGAQAHDDH